MERFGLRNDQWDRIKDFLPGREGHVGGTAEDNRLFVEAILIALGRAVPGAIYRSVSAIGNRFINVSADGRRAEFSSGASHSLAFRLQLPQRRFDVPRVLLLKWCSVRSAT